MNIRKAVYFALEGVRGYPLRAYYERFLREYHNGIPPDTTKTLLIRLLTHCKQSVPYYAKMMRDLGDSFYDHPEEYLKHMPILTKGIIRDHFDELKSTDLARRNWYLNSGSGSTGEQIQFIQDSEYAARSGAITLLFSKLVGRDIGECEVRLWGSMRDISKGSEGWKARFVNKITNTIFLNVFRMDPDRMRQFILALNTKRPELIIAYADAMYELAKFAEQAGLEVTPQPAIITSAETLHSFMREKIEAVFHCRVFNRYGSREVSTIACERPGCNGLWVPPWGNYVEVVDTAGNRVPDGAEGEILVTSLNNFAMPFVRYRIEDRGVLLPKTDDDHSEPGQILRTIVGRTVDIFKGKDGVLVHPGYFGSLLYWRDWIAKYQVIQKSHSHVVFRIVRSGSYHQQGELNEITKKTKAVMGNDCEVSFEFVDDIVPSPSGKYRHIISEVQK
jgi:phenylacetate-CoA ligase